MLIRLDYQRNTGLMNVNWKSVLLDPLSLTSHNINNHFVKVLCHFVFLFKPWDVKTGNPLIGVTNIPELVAHDEDVLSCGYFD